MEKESQFPQNEHILIIFKKNTRNQFEVLNLNDRNYRNYGMKSNKLLRMNVKSDCEKEAEETNWMFEQTVEIAKKRK